MVYPKILIMDFGLNIKMVLNLPKDTVYSFTYTVKILTNKFVLTVVSTFLLVLACSTCRLNALITKIITIVLVYVLF